MNKKKKKAHSRELSILKVNFEKTKRKIFNKRITSFNNSSIIETLSNTEEKIVQFNFKTSESPSTMLESKLHVHKNSPISNEKTGEIICDNSHSHLLNQTIDLCQDENSFIGLSSCNQPTEVRAENIVEIIDLCKDQNEVILLKDKSKKNFIRNYYTPVIDLSKDGNEGTETESGVNLNDDVIVVKTFKNNTSFSPFTQPIAHSPNSPIKSEQKILNSTSVNYSSKKNREISQIIPKISKKKNKRTLKFMLKRNGKLRVNGLHQENLAPRPGSSEIGKNIYFNSPVSLPSSGLRPIIIDGSNVAMGNVGTTREFSCKKLKICIDFFKRRGHKVTAFVPQFRTKFNKSDNPALLNKLVQDGDVILTPSKVVDGRYIVPYDDRFIVQTAVLKGGIIVSRDNYRDLLGENPAWSETINYRTLPFTWVDDVLMFPDDPLGGHGPSLDEFLKFH